jgi:hypothetical protein
MGTQPTARPWSIKHEDLILFFRAEQKRVSFVLTSGGKECKIQNGSTTAMIMPLRVKRKIGSRARSHRISFTAK